MQADRVQITPESVFDYDSLLATELQTEPFDHIHVPHFLRSAPLAAANRDFPAIAKPGNYGSEELSPGPGFQAILDALKDPSFLQIMSDKFGIDLMAKPTTITIRAFCELSDGDIHTDHRSKVVTALLYFNNEWSHEGGCLRLLRSPDNIEDLGVEIPPLGGTLIAFRRSDRSFHGHKRFVGERRMLQLSWLETSTAAQWLLKLDRVGTRLMKNFSRLRAS
jgi:hypothetical protein